MTTFPGRYHWSNIEKREKTISADAAVSGWVELREWADEVVPEDADEVDLAVSRQNDHLHMSVEWVKP
jgi:hypothetical protein